MNNSLSREQRIYRVTLLGSLVNMVLLLGKAAAGVLGHSSAMVADAIHSLSDFITDLVVLALVRLSSKPADTDHDYGHGKYETVATSIIGLALMAVAVLLAWNGVVKILAFVRGEALETPGVIALIAALVSIGSKEWVYQITKKEALAVHSEALEANAWHHRSDAFSSIATAIGIGGALLLGPHWAVLDPIAAVMVSTLIFGSAFRLLISSGNELLEKSLPKEVEDRIIEAAERDPLIRDVHNLHTRRIGSIIAIEMHLRLPSDITLAEAHHHATEAEHRLRKEFGLGTHIMIHIEPMEPTHRQA